jgi:hypothetical protein
MQMRLDAERHPAATAFGLGQEGARMPARVHDRDPAVAQVD